MKEFLTKKSKQFPLFNHLSYQIYSNICEKIYNPMKRFRLNGNF